MIPIGIARRTAARTGAAGWPAEDRHAAAAGWQDHRLLGDGAQHSDDPMPVFSYLGSAAQHPQQLPCWVTNTNERTHEIIRQNSRSLPPRTRCGSRYCPSIGDKIHRFASRIVTTSSSNRKGLMTHETASQRYSTRYPSTCNCRSCVRSGAWKTFAHPLRPDYAIEYDTSARA